MTDFVPREIDADTDDEDAVPVEEDVVPDVTEDPVEDDPSADHTTPED